MKLELEEGGGEVEIGVRNLRLVIPVAVEIQHQLPELLERGSVESKRSFFDGERSDDLKSRIRMQSVDECWSRDVGVDGDVSEIPERRKGWQKDLFRLDVSKSERRLVIAIESNEEDLDRVQELWVGASDVDECSSSSTSSKSGGEG